MTDAYSSLASGLTQGASLSLAVQQAQQQKQQQQWENQYKQFAAGVQLTDATKDKALKAQYFNSLVVPGAKAIFGTDIPKMSPTQPSVSDGLEKFYMQVNKGLTEGKYDHNTAYGMVQSKHAQLIANADTNEEMEKIKSAAAAGAEPFKMGAEQENRLADEKAKESHKTENTPEGIRKRMNEIALENANMDKIDNSNAMMAQIALKDNPNADVTQFKVDPAARAARRAATANEMMALNAKLPEGQRMPVVDENLVDKIRGILATKGVTDKNKQDEYISANYIVKPSSVGPVVLTQ